MASTRPRSTSRRRCSRTPTRRRSSTRSPGRVTRSSWRDRDAPRDDARARGARPPRHLRRAAGRRRSRTASPRPPSTTARATCCERRSRTRSRQRGPLEPPSAGSTPTRPRRLRSSRRRSRRAGGSCRSSARAAGRSDRAARDRVPRGAARSGGRPLAHPRRDRRGRARRDRRRRALPGRGRAGVDWRRRPRRRPYALDDQRSPDPAARP